MFFIDWYQNIPSYLSPIFFSIGSFDVRWYPLGYIFAALCLVGMILIRYKNQNKKNYEEITDLLFFIFLGVLLGGRLGYVFFYQPEYYFFHPEDIFMPLRHTEDGWKVVGIAGMSYHGGVAGAIFACYFFARVKGSRFLDLMDLYVPAGTLGYTFGRLGNFMNGELYGRKTDVLWGMYFKNGYTGQLFDYLRHPSQLYEAFGEGIFLALVLYYLQHIKRWKAGMILSFYLMGYGFIRFLIEFFRQPDHLFRDGNDDIGVVLYWLTMGQVLCIVMMLVGLGLFFYFLHYSHDSAVFSRKSFKASLKKGK